LPAGSYDVKIVAAISPQLFRAESPRYRASVLAPGEWLDSTVISNRGRRTMTDWMQHRIAAERFEHARRAVALFPEAPEFYVHAATACDMLGLHEEGRLVWQNAPESSER
jgi:hypothetical protein